MFSVNWKAGYKLAGFCCVDKLLILRWSFWTTANQLLYNSPALLKFSFILNCKVYKRPNTTNDFNKSSLIGFPLRLCLWLCKHPKIDSHRTYNDRKPFFQPYGASQKILIYSR